MKTHLALAVASMLLVTNAIAAEQSPIETSIIPAPFFTQSKPAVDGINGKAQIFGGAAERAVVPGGIPTLSDLMGRQNFAWYGSAGGTGTISIPVGHSFGIQLDGISGLFANAYGGGGAGHFFWRDPDIGLVGAYGSGLYSALNGGQGGWNAAGELEAYLGRFTVGGLIGAQGSTNNSHNNAYDAFLSPQSALIEPGFFSGSNPTRFFDDVAISYYPTDDLKLSIGHIYSGGLNSASVGAEYLLPEFRGGATAISAYGEAIIGENNNNAIMGGLKVYFGNHDKSLIRRHREDDPHTYLSRELRQISHYFNGPGKRAFKRLSRCSQPVYSALAWCFVDPSLLAP